MRLIAKWFICFGALLIASACFPAQFFITGGLMSLAAAATILWLVNLALRPFLQLISLPITILTFGIFSLVVNAGMVRLTDLLLPVIYIRGFWVCVIIAIIISFGNSFFAPKSRRKS